MKWDEVLGLLMPFRDLEHGGMRISIHVSIEAEPGRAESYGRIQFNEAAQLTETDFDTVTAVFSRVHDLLNVIKREYAQKKG